MYYHILSHLIYYIISYLTASLHHSHTCIMWLPLQACDRGVPEMCSSAIVTISIGDFNDEAPTFDLSIYTVDICHDAMSDQYLVQPVAIDRDSGSNAEITYSLQASAKEIEVDIRTDTSASQSDFVFIYVYRMNSRICSLLTHRLASSVYKEI